MLLTGRQSTYDPLAKVHFPAKSGNILLQIIEVQLVALLAKTAWYGLLLNLAASVRSLVVLANFQD